ncbi:MAG: hypothetical protein ABI076_06935 [Acidobacteriaceae bacterium]
MRVYVLLLEFNQYKTNISTLQKSGHFYLGLTGWDGKRQPRRLPHRNRSGCWRTSYPGHAYSGPR